MESKSPATFSLLPSQLPWSPSHPSGIQIGGPSGVLVVIKEWGKWGKVSIILNLIGQKKGYVNLPKGKLISYWTGD